MNKIAVITMDVEDWYDIEYLKGISLDKSYSMANGVELYANILNEENIQGTFFILSSMLDKTKDILKKLYNEGHEIAVHGKTHERPMTMSLNQFESDIIDAKNEIEKVIGGKVYGYRAPCYSFSIEHLRLLEKMGFKYDSSMINSQSNSFYEKIDLSSFEFVQNGIYRKNNFYEFEISSEVLFKKRCTIAGGGFFRIFPWFIEKQMLKKFIKENDFFVFFIHPYEVSNLKCPKIKGLPLLNKIRMNFGRKRVKIKIKKLIKFLKQNNFEFKTFEKILLNL